MHENKKSIAAPQGRHYIAQRRPADRGRARLMAKGLGWFSIGLGVAELLAPEVIARISGIRGTPWRLAVLRAYGLREIAAGVGILTQERPAGWLWGRVAGDLVDLASLGSATRSNHANRTKVATAAASVVGVTALDAYCGYQLSRDSVEHAKKTLIINRTPDEIYAHLRRVENLPRFIEHLEAVYEIDERKTRWQARALKTTLEWDAELIDDQQGARLAWRSAPGATLELFAAVRLQQAVGGRGTLVTVELEIAAPGISAASKAAKLVRAAPEQQLERALRQLKQILETGDIVHSDASIHRGKHPARPTGELRQHRPASAGRQLEAGITPGGFDWQEG